MTTISWIADELFCDLEFHDDVLGGVDLASTRWKLKTAIKVLNQTFEELSLEKHPDKTAVGKTEAGFDFIGYRFSPWGLSVAKKTLVNFVVHLNRLYERERWKPDGYRRLGEYVRRWWSWVAGGLGEMGRHMPVVGQLCVGVFSRTSWIVSQAGSSPAKRDSQRVNIANGGKIVLSPSNVASVSILTLDITCTISSVGNVEL